MDTEARKRFEAFVVDRWNPLRRMAFLITRDVAVAEDVVQTALVRLCASWARVERADDPQAYAHRVVANAAIDRARKHPVEDNRVPERITPERDHAERLDLETYLARLPAQQRAVLVLRFYVDLSERDIAAALGISPGTVKSHCSRALAALRRELTDQEEHHAR